MDLSRWRHLPWLPALALGLGFGCAISVVNTVGSPYRLHPVVEGGVWPLMLLGAVMGTEWAWAAVAFLVGLLARRRADGPVLGVLALWGAVVAYYLLDWATGVDQRFSEAELVAWGILAVPVGAGMGLLAGVFRHDPRWSAASGIATVAILILLAGSTQHVGTVDVGGWPFVTVLALTVLLALALLIAWVTTRRQITRQDLRSPRQTGVS